MANKSKSQTAKKSTSKKTTYKPTEVAVARDAKGKLVLVVGSRRIAAHKGEILDKGKLYWSQLKYARLATDPKSGRVHLSTAREAAAKGWEVG
jgi:hypothetical protein